MAENNSIKILEDNVEKLFLTIKKSKTEVDVLKEEINELKIVIKNQKETINRLQNKNTLLLLAKGGDTKEGVKDAKIKINELLREIDKCIGVLNN